MLILIPAVTEHFLHDLAKAHSYSLTCSFLPAVTLLHFERYILLHFEPENYLQIQSKEAAYFPQLPP